MKKQATVLIAAPDSCLSASSHNVRLQDLDVQEGGVRPRSGGGARDDGGRT